MTINIAILISGRGSNMMAIHRSILDNRLDAKIELILCDNPKAPGLEYAGAQALPTVLLEKKAGETRAQFDKRMMDEIDVHQVDFIALAGYMRILSSEFVQQYKNKIINIHPSLLPSFPGLHAQKQALEAGVRFSGCTVHFVDEGCDTGPIIDQRIVPVLPDDDEEKLSKRILVEEHKLYSECLQKLAQGKIRIEGRKVLT